MKSPETPWARGRFDGSRRGSQLLFGRMFEDAAIELEAFRGKKRVFCIGSAGCTAFALAAGGHRVSAVDINASQVSYLRGRIEGNSYQPGKAERLVTCGRNLIWSQRRTSAFMDLERSDEQMDYWRRHLNTRRFRWTLRVLMSAATLGLAYSTPMVAAVPPRLDLELCERLERCWARFPNRCNPYARALFLDEPPEMPRFDSSLLEVHRAEAVEWLEQAAPASFHAFTLSNILDAGPDDLRKRLFSAIKKAASPGAVAVLRSFRKLALPGVNRALDDRSILWGTVQAIPVEQL